MKVVMRKLLAIVGCAIILLDQLAYLPVEISAEELKLANTASVIVNATNGQVLYEADAKELLSISGLSKLLVVYLVYEAIDQGQVKLDSRVSISDEAYAVSQDYNVSNVPLRQDKDYSVKELLESIGVCMANGSTIALADHLAGDQEKFMDLMKAKLDEWKVENYHLINSTGLSSAYVPQQVDTYTTGDFNQMDAMGVATIAYHLVHDYPEFLEFTQINQKLFRENTTDRFQMNNPNWLLKGSLFPYEGVEGLAHSGTSKEGESLIAYCQRNEMNVLTVSLGAKKEDAEYASSQALLDYVFENFQAEQVVIANQEVNHLSKLKLANARQETAPLKYGQGVDLIIPMTDTAPTIHYQFYPHEDYFNKQEELLAPLTQGTEIGTMAIEVDGYQQVFLPSLRQNRIPIEVDADIEKGPWWLTAWRRTYDFFAFCLESLRRFFIRILN